MENKENKNLLNAGVNVTLERSSIVTLMLAIFVTVASLMLLNKIIKK